ncbi:hypothetical protein ACET3Z_023293 [Daucus carota]
MVCLFCLLPLFLLPIVNILPLLFDRIMVKVYRLFGWDYRRPERAPPACPYKPPANKINDTAAGEPDPVVLEHVQKHTGVNEHKLD